MLALLCGGSDILIFNFRRSLLHWCDFDVFNLPDNGRHPLTSGYKSFFFFSETIQFILWTTEHKKAALYKCRLFITQKNTKKYDSFIWYLSDFLILYRQLNTIMTLDSLTVSELYKWSSLNYYNIIIVLLLYTGSNDLGIQRAITFLALNRISKALYQINRIPMLQNQTLSLFVRRS